MPRNTFPETIWAGSENTLDLAVAVHDRALAGEIKADMYPEDNCPEDDDIPYLLEKSGSVGVINISGSLKNKAAWYDSFCGQTSYEAIREALVYAANDSSIEHILLDINSGGGAVAGVSDTGRLIRDIHNKVKPVTAYTDGAAASAAYWLGCSAGKMYASETAMTGSIGVLAVHQQYSKMLEMEGITATVVRSGEEKALVNPYEPLSAKARANLQSQLDVNYKIFVNHVAEMRGMSYAVADNSAQGKEYIGMQAVDAGLVDGIKNFDAVMSQILDSIENSANTRQRFNTGGNQMPRATLTDKDIAAIAAGAPIVAEVKDGLQEGDGQEEVVAAVEGEDAQASVEDDGVAAPQADAQAAPVQAASELVAFLQAQVKDKDAELLACKVENKALADKVASMEATHAGLVAIAAQSATNMKVALGHSGVDLTGMSAEALLAEHQATAEQFKASFVVGGVAAVSSEPAKTEKQAAPVMDAKTSARFAAVRFQTN